MPSIATPRVFRGRVAKSFRPAPPPFGLPPVHFFAEALVDSGSEAPVRSEALTNHTGKPVEIHEIRFAAFPQAQAQFYQVNPGGFVSVRITIGGKPVTNGFVPLWMLGKTEQELEQSIGVSTYAVGVYTWRLSRPMLLTDKMPVDVQFQHSGAVRFQVRAMIGLAGRYASPGQTTVALPYAASFMSKGFVIDTLDYDESSESDLVNKTTRTLNVDRIIARVGVSSATGNQAIASFRDTNMAAPSRVTTVRIHTSDNLPIVPNYSSIRAVFGDTRSLDIPFTMKPNDFLRVGVKNIVYAPASVVYTTYISRAYVSLVGWREETF